MTDIAIRVQNISKCYHIYDNPRDRLKQLIVPTMQRLVRQPPKQYYNEFWALQDISFTIRKGETVGIIGRNGSGKSTLLQLICGTLFPTHGSVETSGRLAALLELGSGFNPEFTGRENVYMNAAVLGLSKPEVDARFDDIAAFADIGKFIEQPVKSYSSGMYVRLAFAVNILSSPEIMIVDEALAVGDMAFQAKCMTALTRIQDQGATVLFVSHDISALRSLCSQGIFLERGKIKAVGKAPEVAEMYVKAMREDMNAQHQKFSRLASAPAAQRQDPAKPAQTIKTSATPLKRCAEFDQRVAGFRYGAGGVTITYVELLNTEDEPIQLVEFNQEVKIRIHIEASCEQKVSINFNIRDDKKVNIVGGDFSLVAQELLETEIGGQYWVEYALMLPLQEGVYSLRAQVTSPLALGEAALFLDVLEDAVTFQMARWGMARLWSKVHLFPKFELHKVDNHG